jgi:predicted transcriptional regulator
VKLAKLNAETVDTPPREPYSNIFYGSSFKPRSAGQACATCIHTEALVVEAVERMANHDEWFVREVEKGIAAADRGELIEHSEVMRLRFARMIR